MIDFVYFCTAKIEDADLPIPKVDTIISEPIGVLLFHERMVIFQWRNGRDTQRVTFFVCFAS